jgi:hypothetical protein
MAWKHNGRPPWTHFFTPPFGWNENLDIPIVIFAQCGTCLEVHEVINKRCRNEVASEYIDWDCLNPYLYIRAQRAQFGVLQHQEEDESDETDDEDTSFLIYSQATQNEEFNIVGEMNFDLRPIELPPDRSGALQFIGIVCYVNPKDILHVEAICIKPSDDCPNVFERVGVAHIRKDAWDQAAYFDENIILG